MSLRTQIIRLAVSLPASSEERKQLLRVLASSAKQADAPTPSDIRGLIAALKRIQGVRSVYITDVYPEEQWYHLRVVLENKATVEGRRQIGATFEIRLRATSGYVTVYNIPDFKRTVTSIRAVVRASGMSVDNISSPTKLYEYQDAWTRSHGGKDSRLGGYDENEVSVEVWSSATAG